MYSSLLNSEFNDFTFNPMSTVYVLSDSQLEELNRKHQQVELDNLKYSRKRLEEVYQSRIKFINKRQKELKNNLERVSPIKKEE